MTEATARVAYVTAADAAYFRALINLVGSIHHWDPDASIDVYDLGLDARQRVEVGRWRNSRLRADFLDAEVPAHCRDLRTYAWKPWVIRHCLDGLEAVLWIDAGSELRGTTAVLKRHLVEDGHFFARGQDTDMTRKSHPGMYHRLGLRPGDFRGRDHFAGSIQGYVAGSAAARDVLDPMYHHAMDMHCIAPPGSGLHNHRYDQSLMSLLIYSSALAVVPRTQLLASHREQLPADRFEPAERVVHTARGRSIDYLRCVLGEGGKRLYER